MKYVKQLLNNDNSLYYNDLKDGLCGDYSIITYRKHYDCINGDVINTIIEKILNYSSYEIEYYYKNNMPSYIIDSLKAYSCLSLKKAIELAKIVKNSTSSDEIICATLQALFNKRYEVTVLYGVCQDDFIKCFYAVDEIEYKYIKYIEAVLFNTGIEIMIHDGSDDPSSVDDVDGYCEYLCISGCDIKKEVAEFLNVKPDELKLWLIKNTYTVIKCEYAEE